jgi:hypothetical protein
MDSLPFADLLFDEGGAGPSFFAGYIGEIRPWSFPPDLLPPGWVQTNGDQFLLTSFNGQVLNNLDSKIKTAFGISISGNYISVPDLIDDNGDGYFIRSVDGVTRQVGSIQEDAGRKVSGYIGGCASSPGINDSVKVVSLGQTGMGGGGTMCQVSMDSTLQWGEDHTAAEFRPKNIGFVFAMYLGVEQ